MIADERTSPLDRSSRIDVPRKDKNSSFIASQLVQACLSMLNEGWCLADLKRF